MRTPLTARSWRTPGLLVLALLAAPWALADEGAPVLPLSPKRTLSAHWLFAFKQSTLLPAAKPQLDAFAADLKTLDYEILTVTGYTDRTGDLVHNLKLSERRAQAVSNYLIQVAGIPASKVLSRGRAGANAVTQPKECVGTQVTKALIACLQPDRRVELEVVGSR